MTTCLDVVNESRSLVNGAQMDPVTQLLAPYSPGDSTLALRSTAGITTGTLLSVGLTTFVCVADPSSSSVEVIAGPDGSQAVSHPGNSIVWVKPRFTNYSLWLALRSAISEMNAAPSGMYGVGRFEPVIDGDESALAIPLSVTDLLKVLEVRRRPAGGYFENTWDQILGWELKNNAGGGQVIRLTVPVSRSDTVEVIYAKRFTSPSSLDDDLETDVGLSPTMGDIPALLIASRMLVSAEGRRVRTDLQGEGRRPGEVREASVAQSGREFRRIAESRMRDEALSLVRSYGFRRQM